MKRDGERIASLETFNEINMREHAEIKKEITDLKSDFSKLGQDIMTAIRDQENKYVLRKEFNAGKWVLGILATIIGIIVYFLDK